jgi:hypothetical protein
MNSWLRAWPRVLYAITVLTYGVLLYVPYRLSKLFGCQVNLPDLNPFFAPSEFAQFSSCIMQTIPDGRSGFALFVAWHANGVDLIFPALFALALIVLTWRTADRSVRFDRQNFWLKLAVVGFMPIAYAVFDYIENNFVKSWLFTGNEGINERMITTATTLKFTFLAIALAILILFVLATLKRQRAK